jgi:hypothetical protein
MTIKRFAFAVAACLTISCNGAIAGVIYSVDPTQSWVSAYVPTWELSPFQNGWSYTDANGQVVASGPNVPTWQLTWNRATFALSGRFEGTTELSPWVPDVGHFTISQGQFNVALPSPETFDPIPLFTFFKSTGHIQFEGGACAVDSFYPSWPGWSCTGFSNGILPSLTGTFDGETLDIQGGTGGYFSPIFISTYVGLAPPSSVDPSLFPQYQSYDYKIVASAVPEPGTFALALAALGGLMVTIARRRKNTQITRN